MSKTLGCASLGVLMCGVVAASEGHAQQATPPLPPLPSAVLKKLRADPQAWLKFRQDHATVRTVRKPAPDASAPVPPPPGPAWQLLTSAWSLSNPLLLTDGTVIAHESCTPTWHRLTPDINGSYRNGTWSDVAPMPSGYGPRFFGSQVLPDGRVYVAGGEYNGPNCDQIESNRVVLYDPVTNTWSDVPPPPGWSQIGDGSTVVLPNGLLLQANCCGPDTALFNPATLGWTATGAGKRDTHSEENWTLLPNGTVLVIDGNNDAPCVPASEIYTPSTGAWTSAGSTIHQLSACSGVRTGEAPTQILTPSGVTFAFSTRASLPRQNFPVQVSIYRDGVWAARGKMPAVAGINYTMADAPAAILSDNNILLVASPGAWENSGSFPSPAHTFILSLASGTPVYTQVSDMTDAASMSSYQANLLVLPTGEIFGGESDFPNTNIFTPAATPSTPGVAPKITSVSSTSLAPGGSYTLTGRQLSGLTQGSSLGDDAQSDSNFPLVRITNQASGHVFYARTYGFVRQVARNTASSTQFQVPGGIETGASSLVAVANGIPSLPVAVTVVAGPVASSQ